MRRGRDIGALFSRRDCLHVTPVDRDAQRQRIAGLRDRPAAHVHPARKSLAPIGPFEVSVDVGLSAEPDGFVGSAPDDSERETLGRSQSAGSVAYG